MILCLHVTLVGLLMSLLFNVTIARLWLAYPRAVVSMLPKQVQQVAPKPDLLQRKKMRKWLFWIYLLTFGLGLGTTVYLPVRGFWPLFMIGYWQLFLVNVGDLIGLDWLFRQKMIDHLMIPGTEDCPDWQTRNWMLHLGLPEHLFLWPLLVCPIAGLLYQVINLL